MATHCTYILSGICKNFCPTALWVTVILKRARSVANFVPSIPHQLGCAVLKPSNIQDTEPSAHIQGKNMYSGMVTNDENFKLIYLDALKWQRYFNLSFSWFLSLCCRPYSLIPTQSSSNALSRWIVGGSYLPNQYYRDRTLSSSFHHICAHK